jgi:hypothetical protein
MKLGNKKLRISILLIATLIVGLAVYIYSENTGLKSIASAETNQELALTRPTFSADVAASSSFLNEEAGFAIWLNATAYAPFTPSQMNAAKSVITNPENVTSDYVIGSISLQAVGFSTDDSPHCFVHRSGWIVVYWLKVNTANPSTTGWLGKTFPLFKNSLHTWYDKDSHALSDNLLHYALVLVCQALTVDPSSAQYYHFQYPSAKTLELAIKTAKNGETKTFNIKVPGTLTIDERSWSYYPDWSGYLNIDTTQICSGFERQYGGLQITSTVLTPDLWHTITINGGGGDTTAGIIILYH